MKKANNHLSVRNLYLTGLFLVLSSALFGQPLSSSNPFYVGHSLINHTIPYMVNKLAESGGKTSEYTEQIINGSPIKGNWESTGGEGTNYRTALPTGKYDAFIITEAVPLLNHTTWSGTYEYANNFLTYARTYKPNIRYFIYETWHCINTGLPARCSYDEDDDLLWEPRLINDYPKWVKIVDSVKKLQNYQSVYMIPGGQAMHALAAEITAGNLSGFTSYRELFSDDIHLNNSGMYFISCVMYSCIFRESPVGLSNTINNQYGGLIVEVPSAVALKMQQVAWSTVCANAYSGVNCSSTTYTLNATASNGSVSKNPNTATYASGSVVTLTATPNSGYTFTGWSGDATGTTNPLSVTMNANKNINANFALNTTTYTLNVTANNGSVSKNPNTATYAVGSSVTLTATPNSGYSFTGWSGDATGTTNPLSVTMNANKNITANFALNSTTYTLNVTANNGSVSKNPNTATYAVGSSVTLTATPNSGYSFNGWSGDATGSTNPLSVTMNANKNITANFALSTTTYTLTVTATNGSVSKSPNTATYVSGSTVTLTATPSSGYTFTGWSGGASGTSNPITITMNSNKTIKANFIATPTNGISDAEAVKAEVYAFPNPVTNGKTHLEITGMENAQTARICIIDISGKTVYNNNTSSLSCDIDCSALRSGLYILVVDAEAFHRTIKLIIE